MRVNIHRTKNHEFVYIIKDIYSDGHRTSKIHLKLGKLADLCLEKNMSRDQVISWAKDYAKRLTDAENKEKDDIIIKFAPSKLIDLNVQRKFNCGYLFLQSIYSQLRFDNICRNISARYQYHFDLNRILADLVYARILYPASKRASFDFAQSLLEKPKYDLHDIYRALSVLGQESDYIQAELYRNSHFIKNRNTSTLYYDCTNYYFEIEEDDDLRKYGKSKENRPNPIVGMGLMMDGDGLPLCFDIYPGNQNEQISLKPLEQKVIKDFQLSKFIYCSDAGLGSKSNKQLNSLNERAYIVTQSLKKLKKDDRETALNGANFKEVGGSAKFIKLKDIDFTKEENKQKLYYKELDLESPIKERLIITYSPKYAAYQKSIRENQINRAKSMIENNGKLKKNRKNPNDPARFLSEAKVDSNGEIVDTYYTLDEEKIREEEKYDGYYGLTTNLDDEDVSGIIAISERRWQIEECFRIMKKEFSARPINVRLEDRIRAHFLTCFIALLIYRILEDKLEKRYTITEILKTLRGMELVDTQYNGYIPAYTRTELTDELHKIFEFRTDYEIISKKKMRNIIKQTKLR